MGITNAFSTTTNPGSNGGTPAGIAAPAWVTRLDYDATAPATFGALAAGSNVIGSLDWVVTTVVPVTIDHTQGVGITVTGLVTALQALQTNVQGVLVGGGNLNPVRVCMVTDTILINTNSQSVTGTATSGVMATTGTSRVPGFGLRIHRTASNDFKMRTVTNGTGSNVAGSNGVSLSTGVQIATALPASTVHDIYIYNQLAAGLITPGTLVIPAGADPFAAVFEPNTTYNRASYMSAISDKATAIDCWPALWVGPGITATGTLTYTYIIKRILVQEWV